MCMAGLFRIPAWNAYGAYSSVETEKLWYSYLMPFVGADLNNYEDERDFIWRQPFRKLRKRPIYANPKERTKLTFSKKR